MSNGILIGLTIQGKTKVAKYYKEIVHLKSIVYEKWPGGAELLTLCIFILEVFTLEQVDF